MVGAGVEVETLKFFFLIVVVEHEFLELNSLDAFW